MLISFISVFTEIYDTIELCKLLLIANMASLRLLIIGGYGTFGGHIANLLAPEPSIELLIAGRSVAKARAFVERHGGDNLLPVAFDRDHDPATQIRKISPDFIIDASGPFQGYGKHRYRIAEAAIAIGAHYIDLADGTEFVTDIVELDSRARAKNVFVLTGASTCPVLTIAVARALCSDLVSVDSVSGGIAPSPFAGMGKSVVRAIAGYAGKPVKRVVDGKLATARTFTNTRDFTIAPPGGVPLAPMRFSLIDVPDLRILATLPMPVTDTWFGVATTPPIYHRLLRSLAHMVRLRLLPTLRPLAGLMHFVMNRLSWGEHRGGMFVEVTGTSMLGKTVCRSWNLVAEGDKGPMVPALAAVAIIRRYQAGQSPASGARSAHDTLNLADYDELFSELEIKTGEREHTSGESRPIFEQILSGAWNNLPTPLKVLHATVESTTFRGNASITRGTGIFSKLIGWAAGFPAEGNAVPTTVHIEHENGQETWRRNFDGKELSSVMSVGNGRFAQLLCEKIGPTKMGMALVPDGNRLRYLARRWSFLGIPLPKKLAPMGEVYETTDGDQFVFHVEINVPIIGHIVTYHGQLNVEDSR